MQNNLLSPSIHFNTFLHFIFIFSRIMSFENKVILVTGASSGIGQATAELLATKKAKLVLVGRNTGNLEQVNRKCKANGAAAVHTIVADVCVESEAKRIIDETIATFGQFDVLVNSAGIIEIGSIETTSLRQYDNVMNVNVRAIFELTRLAIPHLIKSQGNIVNVSSVCGIRSFPNALVYNMSKAAIDQFTNCIALELAAHKVRVSVFCVFDNFSYLIFDCKLISFKRYASIRCALA